MSAFEYLKNAIDALRDMERKNLDAETLYNFDFYIRKQIFGNGDFMLTVGERTALQDYYMETL